MKKIIYLCFFLCLITTVKAQVVNIPDPNFKAALITAGVDTNADTQIQTSEALAVTSLNVKTSSISDLTGIESFTNLQSLNCSDNALTSLKLSTLTKLTSLSCNTNLIVGIDLRNGVANNISLNATANPPLASICIDAGDVVTGGPFPNGVVPTFSAAPTGAATQTFCNGATVANLVATGTAIKWYATPTGGTALANTAILTSTNYYASQTTANCESSTRLAVAVTVNTTPAPTAATPQTFCNAATVADLTATGTGVKWYNTATATVPMDPTKALTTGITVYATQTLNGCESATRTAVAVIINVNATPAPTAATPQTFCNAATVADLTATGTGVKWYNTATATVPMDPTKALTTGITVYATQTLNGCESATRTAVAVIINATAAPTAATPQTFCNAATVADLTATGTGVKWYNTATATVPMDPTKPLGTGTTVYATQTLNGCESARTAVAVIINVTTPPTAATPQTFCNAAIVADLTATGTDVKWYNTATATVPMDPTKPLGTGTTVYATQTLNGCESTRTAVAVIINVTTPPTAATPQTFCNAAIVADLTATGTDVKWYNTATATVPMDPTKPLGTGTTVYATQTLNGCESTRTAVAVIINITAPPTAATPQTFCNAAIVADLTATGTDVKWYNTATATVPMDPTKPLGTGTTVYATQTLNGCESARTAVAVIINVTAAPTVASPQSFCQGATVADLKATGTAIKWYLIPGSLPLDPTIPLVTKTFYVTQTLNGCESELTPVAVTVNVTPPPTTVNQAFCTGATVADLKAVGTAIKWYIVPGSVALDSTIPLVTSTYYATQTLNGCESALASISVAVTTTAAPTAPTIQTFCNSAIVADLAATGTNIRWYDVATGGTALAPTTALAPGTYYASQTANACESTTRKAVFVLINQIPIPSPTAPSPQAFCGGATVADLQATGIGIKWYLIPGSVALDPTTPLITHSYLVTQSIGTCESAPTTIQVTVSTPPPTAPTPQTFCNAATVADLKATGTAIKWYLVPGSVALASTVSLITHTYYVTQTANGCESALTPVEVTVNVTPAPTAATPQTFCGAATVADLQATGTAIKWYIVPGSVALDPTTALVTHSYLATQTLNGCESPVTTVAVTVNGTTPPPTAASPQTFCAAATVADLKATGTAIKWYIVPGSVALDSTDPLITHSYLATQTINGCESVATTVEVTVHGITPPPSAPSPQTFCGAATVADLAASGTNIKWYLIPGSVALDPSVPLITHTYLVTQTINGCESAAVEVAVTVNGTTPPPTAASPQAFCGTATVADLKATGTAVKWYLIPGSVALDSTDPLITHSYLATQTINGCESAATTVAVTVNGITPPPTAPSPQAFCGAATVADLKATGTAIKWYLIPGSVALDSTDPLITHSYLATQTLNGCESTVTTVAVTVNGITPPPTAASPQTFCGAATVADLKATGTAIKWYLIPGSVALDPTDPLVTHTYLVTQTLNGCESAATTVAVTINSVTSPPTAPSPQTFCGAATVADLQATGTAIKWYLIPGSVALDPTDPLVTHTYLVTQTLNGCESAVTTVAVTVNAGITPPVIGTITQPTCAILGSVVLNGLPVGNWVIQQTGTASQTITGSTSSVTVSDLAIGTYNYSITSGGCTSVLSEDVVMTKPIAPNAPLVGTITQPTCSDSGSVVLYGLPSGNWTITRNLVGGGEDDEVLYYGNTTQYTVTGLSAGTYTFQVADITYCSSKRSEKVVITASGAPNAPLVGTITQPTCAVAGSVVLNGLPSGNWTISQYLVGGTDADKVLYYGSTTQYTVTGLSEGTYQFSVSDITYCTSKKTEEVVMNQPVPPNTPIVGTITQPTCSTSGSVELDGLPSGNWTISQYLVGGTDADKVLYYGATNQYTVTGLSAGTYQFSVHDITYCTSIKTEEVVINAIDCHLGVNKYDISGLEYYPNPVIDFITLSNTNVITSVELFNLLGQHILSVRPNATTTKVDMSSLAIGTYLVQVQSEGKTATIKIIKSK